jgi:CBS domain-containing protein
VAAKTASCVIHRETGDVETIWSLHPSRTEVPGVPTIAGIVPVTDVMTRDVICVSGEVSLETVIALLVDNYISCVPVVDDDGCPRGMLTNRDVVESLHVGAQPPTAASAMLPIVFTVDEHATVAQAAALMAEQALHHVPVVSARGRVIGIVSSLDIVRWLVRNDAEG